MGETVAFAPRETTPTEQAYQVMQHAITTRREAFIAEYQAGKYGSTFATYEDELDRAVYQELGKFSTSNQEGFSRAKNELDGYTKFQLETSIGERLNVGLSTYHFGIREGVLYGENMDEPLVGMIDRGRQTRNAQVDKLLEEKKIAPQTAQEIKQRHDAEVKQFEKIQEIMGGAKTLPGTTMISVSPPGPGYAHNFYDVFILKEKPDGTRYVEARRYASALSAEESLVQAKAIQPGYGTDRRDAALIPYFLAHPITIKDPLHILFNQPDTIHSFLQGDHGAMTEADFTLIKAVISGIISVYLQEVFAHPENADRHAEILDALKNKADEAVGNIKALREQTLHITARRESFALDNTSDSASFAYAAALADINRLGSQNVRVVTTGCGESGSSRKKRNAVASVVSSASDLLPGNMSSWSLLDDILDEENPDGKGPLEFKCDKCSGKHTRPLGKTLPACPKTGEKYEQCG